MKTLTAWTWLAGTWLILCPLLAFADPQLQPWRQITVPTVAEAARTFADPPKEYGAIHWAIWGGAQTKERILADIEHIYANGGGVYMINNSQRVKPQYLSPEYLDLVKFVVDECKKRGMYVWIEGDCGYPDGFAGGLITQDYPQLGQQGIVADAHCTIAGGQTVSFPLPSDTLGIFASQSIGTAQSPTTTETFNAIPIPADGKLDWRGANSTQSVQGAISGWYGIGGSSYEVVVQDANGISLRYSLAAGQTLHIQVPPNTRSIEYMTRGGGARGGGPRAGGVAGVGGGKPTIIPLATDGQFNWTAPAGGSWEITFVRHVYRSSPTRNDAGESGGATKDGRYSEIDYLDPVATATYLKLIHQVYEKVVGDEFGKTILGWRLDETDYTGFSPWTPKLLETFKAQKGYDLQPYLAEMFASPQDPESERVKADYWDVWSGMFANNFFKPLEEWCQARGMEYMGHLNHEETQFSMRGESMVANEGSYWRDVRQIGVPGIDNLNQIGPGIIADFPKIAASAAHMNGRPLVWEEEGGDPSTTGKFVFDYQLARGVNYMNFRGLNAAPAQGVLMDRASAMGRYFSRSQHMMAIGRPAAQVALFHPTDTYWLGGQESQESDAATVKLQMELIRHQIDFDHVDSDALGSYLKLEDGGLKNLSGQVYKAVIIPSSSVIEKTVLDRLRAFASAGGKVIFVGRTPSMVVGRTFLHPESGAPDLSFATLVPTPDITERVVAALPYPDVKLDVPCDMINYLHRSLADGEVYFFFNESRQTQSRTATLAGTGQVQVWDAGDGTIHPLAGVDKANGSVAVPLTLGPQGAMLLVIGPLPAQAGPPLPTFTGNKTLAALDGDWSITLGASPLVTPLKSWEELLGSGSFDGIAQYSKSFNLPNPPPAGQRTYLDLGDVGEVAHVRLNGTDYDARGWPPYLWDVTDSLKSGDNALEIQVQVPPITGRGGGFGGTTPAAAGGATTAPASGRAARGRGPAGGGIGQTAAPPSPRGLLGPVRLLSQ